MSQQFHRNIDVPAYLHCKKGKERNLGIHIFFLPNENEYKLKKKQNNIVHKVMHINTNSIF